MVGESALFHFGDDVVVVSIVDVLESMLTNHCPAHHHSDLGVAGDIVQEVILKIFQNVLSHLKCLHEVESSPERLSLTKVYLGDIFGVVEHCVLKSVSFNLVFAKFFHVLTPTTSQVTNCLGILTAVKIEEKGRKRISENVYSLVCDCSARAFLTLAADVLLILPLDLQFLKQLNKTSLFVFCIRGDLPSAAGGA